MSEEIAERIVQELSNMNNALIVIVVFIGMMLFFKDMHGK